MQERTLVLNGRFERDLAGWNGTGTYSPGDGDAHFGVAVLATGGGYVGQLVSVPVARQWTVHVAVKAVGADLSAGQAVMRILENGVQVVEKSLSGTADTWVENEWTLGLPSSSLEVRFVNLTAGGDVKVDDVWVWRVPMSRAAMAARVAAQLGELATEYALSTAADGVLTEGDYTYAVDAGLRSVGAVDPVTGEMDLRYVDEQGLPGLLVAIEQEMLKRLSNTAMLETDIRLGPRQESRSQLAKMLQEVTGRTFNQPGNRRAVSREITYPRLKDYEA